MSTIKSSSDHLTLNADGASKDIKFQANGVEKVVIDSSGNVGIGNTVATTLNTASDAGNLAVGSGSGNEGITIYSGSANKGFLAFADGTTGSDPYRFYFKYDHNSDLFTMIANGNVDSLVIDSSGNVGIGTTPEAWDSGQTVLQVGGLASFGGDTTQVAGNSARMLNNAYLSGGWKYQITDQASFYSQYDGTHSFRVAPSGTADSAISWITAMTIDNNGAIYQGDTTSNVGSGDHMVSIKAKDSAGLYRALGLESTESGNRLLVSLINPNGTVGTISTSGSATSYNTSSDYRLKENVVPMTGSIDRLKALNPSRFNFIADADTTVDGFLAHEAQEVVPEAITGTKDAMMTEEYEVTPAVMDGEKVVTEAVMGEREVPDMQGIDQSKLVPLLVASLQEAIARIEVLEAQLKA
jgi:hypothetical protein